MALNTRRRWGCYYTARAGGGERYVWHTGDLLGCLWVLLVQLCREMNKDSGHSLRRAWGPRAQGSLKDEGMDHSSGKPQRPREGLSEGEGNLECMVEEGNRRSRSFISVAVEATNPFSFKLPPPPGKSDQSQSWRCCAQMGRLT